MKRVTANRSSIGTVSCIALRRTVTLPQVIAGRTSIVLVRKGMLELARDGVSCCVRDRQLVVIPAGMAFDLTYRASENYGFVADCLIPCQAAGRDDASCDEMAMPGWLPRPIDAIDPQFRQCLDRAVAAIQDSRQLPDVIAIHHMREVFHWISLNGGWVGSAIGGSVSMRVWNVCASDPARSWTAEDVADKIGLSASRLRSRLGEEGTTLALQLHDVKIGHALSLLLATNMPIYTIAREIGYRSTARFSIRFRERYGLLPCEVRGNQPSKVSRHASQPSASRSAGALAVG